MELYIYVVSNGLYSLKQQLSINGTMKNLDTRFLWSEFRMDLIEIWCKMWACMSFLIIIILLKYLFNAWIKILQGPKSSGSSDMVLMERSQWWRSCKNPFPSLSLTANILSSMFKGKLMGWFFLHIITIL